MPRSVPDRDEAIVANPGLAPFYHEAMLEGVG